MYAVYPNMLMANSHQSKQHPATNTTPEIQEIDFNISICIYNYIYTPYMHSICVYNYITYIVQASNIKKLCLSLPHFFQALPVQGLLVWRPHCRTSSPMPVMPSMTYIAAWVGNFGIQFQPNIQCWICLRSASRVLFNMEKKRRIYAADFFQKVIRKVTLNPSFSKASQSAANSSSLVGYSCWNSEVGDQRITTLRSHDSYSSYMYNGCTSRCDRTLEWSAWNLAIFMLGGIKDSVGWFAVPYNRYQLLH